MEIGILAGLLAACVLIITTKEVDDVPAGGALVVLAAFAAMGGLLGIVLGAISS